MSGISTRLSRRIQSDFPGPGSADEILRLVSEASDDERVQAAIVLWAGGDVARLQDAVRVAGEDWRDVLVRGGLADEDWREKMDLALGPALP